MTELGFFPWTDVELLRHSALQLQLHDLQFYSLSLIAIWRAVESSGAWRLFFFFFFQTRLRIRDITGPTFELGLVNRAGHVIQGRLHTRTLLKTRSCFVRLKHEGTKLDIFLELENSKVQNAAFRKNIWAYPAGWGVSTGRLPPSTPPRCLQSEILSIMISDGNAMTATGKVRETDYIQAASRQILLGHDFLHAVGIIHCGKSTLS